MTRRICVDGGMLVEPRDARPIDGPASNAPDDSAVYYVLVQVSDLDGTPTTANYRGPGTIVRHDDKRLHLVTGDPQTTTTMFEYLVDDKATPASEKAFDDFRAGFTAGYLGKRARRNVDGMSPYMDGFKAGRAAKN